MLHFRKVPSLLLNARQYPSRSQKPASAFTLIELLCVVAIISLLVSLLLPAMQNIRAVANAALCAANLKKFQLGWQTAMQASPTIPYTFKSTKHPNWIDVIEQAVPNEQFIYGNNAITSNSCPAVQNEYRPMFYVYSRMGYVVNTWWSNEGGLNNDLQSWNTVRCPSNYPWFMDPEAYQWSPGFIAAHRVPFDFLAPDYGIGANHNKRQSVNVSFADGSWRSVLMSEVRLKLNGPGDYAWLENR
jgi:prepilin-type N-terminal cleavage/methylation domain-containing protein/prepilin-type processing-associated H-X9-DG protein